MGIDIPTHRILKLFSVKFLKTCLFARNGVCYDKAENFRMMAEVSVSWESGYIWPWI